MKIQNHTNLQPSFGNYEIARETFQYLPQELSRFVRKEINECEPILKNKTKSFHVNLGIDSIDGKKMDINIRKNENGIYLSLPLDNLPRLYLKKYLESLIDAFREVIKSGKKMNTSEFKNAVMNRQIELFVEG